MVAVLSPVIALLISSNVSINQLVTAILTQGRDVEPGGALVIIISVTAVISDK
jgi:hypothetical protein